MFNSAHGLTFCSVLTLLLSGNPKLLARLHFLPCDSDRLVKILASLPNHKQCTEVLPILCERILNPLMPGFNVETLHMLPVRVLHSTPLFLHLCLVISKQPFSFVAVYCVPAAAAAARFTGCSWPEMLASVRCQTWASFVCSVAV